MAHVGFGLVWFYSVIKKYKDPQNPQIFTKTKRKGKAKEKKLNIIRDPDFKVR